MKLCQNCKNEIAPDYFIGRQTQCVSCGADLHCCLNCVFYDISAYNNCREPQAERVLEKSRSNFCDFFSFNLDRQDSGSANFNARDKLEELFNKTS